jgi:hypothetical protein
MWTEDIHHAKKIGQPCRSTLWKKVCQVKYNNSSHDLSHITDSYYRQKLELGLIEYIKPKKPFAHTEHVKTITVEQWDTFLTLVQRFVKKKVRSNEHKFFDAGDLEDFLIFESVKYTAKINNGIDFPHVTGKHNQEFERLIQDMLNKRFKTFISRIKNTDRHGSYELNKTVQTEDGNDMELGELVGQSDSYNWALIDFQNAQGCLTELQRTAIYLREWKDWKLKDIAKAMGCSVSNVRQHIQAGLKRMEARDWGDAI